MTDNKKSDASYVLSRDALHSAPVCLSVAPKSTDQKIEDR